MAPKCSICIHPERVEIDRALLAGDASFRNMAERFGTSTTSLHRHKTDHLSQRMSEVAERNADADVRTAIDVVVQLREVNEAARSVLTKAQESGDGVLTLQAAGHILKQIELQARLIDLISDGTTVNVTVSPEWIEIRAFLITTLAAYPDAAQAVSSGLLVLEGGKRAS